MRATAPRWSVAAPSATERGAGRRPTERPRSKLHFARLAVALAVAFAAHPVAAAPTQAASQTLRVLLVGNSYTYTNDGIDVVLGKLAPQAKVDRIAVGGYRLEQFASEGKVRDALGSKHYDVVVLQEQSQTPVVFTHHFREGALALDRQIRAAGAKTALLMTWERPDSARQGVTTANLAAAYKGMGAEIGAAVAPAGLAFARALRERPNLALASDDGHPTPQGTYLAACVLYATLFGASPVGNAYADSHVSADERTFLQRIAAETTGR